MILLARAISAVHVTVIALSLVAWSLPWTAALWAAVIGYPLIQLGWCAFGNRCPLTVLEERLRARARLRSVGTDPQTEPPLHFAADLLSLLLRRPVSRVWGDVFSYTCVWGGFAIAAARLYARQP
ncbi:MAG TPA: hypothetical protein VKH41_00395 [Myxococcota bacterium]|nr:hypothetical protein [Myxococcota bacterium]